MGEWVNAENSGFASDPQKIVFREDLSAGEFTSVTGTAPAWIGKGTLRKSWVDAEAYRYCQVHWVYSSGLDPLEGAALFRVDTAGQTFEATWFPGAAAAGKQSEWVFAQLETWDPGLPRKLMLSGQWSVYNRTYTVYRRR